MKALILILSLILVASNNSNACNVVEENDIRELIEMADEVTKRVENDEDYKNLGELPADQQQYYSSMAMKPIDFNTNEHQEEFPLAQE